MISQKTHHAPNCSHVELEVVSRYEVPKNPRAPLSDHQQIFNKMNVCCVFICFVFLLRFCFVFTLLRRCVWFGIFRLRPKFVVEDFVSFVLDPMCMYRPILRCTFFLELVIGLTLNWLWLKSNHKHKNDSMMVKYDRNGLEGTSATTVTPTTATATATTTYPPP